MREMERLAKEKKQTLAEWTRERVEKCRALHMNRPVCVQTSILHINPESDRAMGHLCTGMSFYPSRAFSQEGGWLKYVYRNFLQEM
jgi:hypothetical protein